MNPPSVNFELAGVGKLVSFFNLRPVIDQAILDAMNNMMVLPKRMVSLQQNAQQNSEIQLEDIFDNSAADIVRPLPRGVLKVRVKKARNLRGAGRLGPVGLLLNSERESEPYVDISVGGVSYKTPHIKRDGNNPIWSEESASFIFLVDIPEQQSLSIRVFNHDTWASDSKIAETR